MTASYLIYGAYGFTGRLIARRAVELGDRPVLAGRGARRLRRLADELGLEHVVFGLQEPERMRAALDRVSAVVHAAGPFVRTWRPMAEACVATGTHYLDITGEIEVFEALRHMGPAAAAAGVALLPGAGFDVVPTDCAAALAVARLAEPTRLDIAFHSRGAPSRGTLRTMVEHLDAPQLERREGRIVPIERPEPLRVPFTDRARDAVPISWGDVATAYHSTGVADIRTYRTASGGFARLVALVRRARPVVRTAAMRNLLGWGIDRMVAEGPDDEELAQGRSRIWCRARDERSDDEAVVELVTPNGYTFTARSAVAAVRRLLDPVDVERSRVGFLTPSRAFGATFAESIDGVERVEAKDGPRTREPEDE